MREIRRLHLKEEADEVEVLRHSPLVIMWLFSGGSEKTAKGHKEVQILNEHLLRAPHTAHWSHVLSCRNYVHSTLKRKREKKNSFLSLRVKPTLFKQVSAAPWLATDVISQICIFPKCYILIL